MRTLNMIEVYEAQLGELKYSSKWKQGKHVAVDTDLDAPTLDTGDDDELVPVVGPITTGSISTSMSSAIEARLVEHLDEELACLLKLLQ